ncbi:MAG: bifunctional phosphopantothenoylcysteine decarboxylase/phosphopantothenate--cysteine ligase CoaBC [Armatimonadota bacterium]|nr:bifunctional phosphopantothenoylcysteine decarboxylase/phosphopantothenate--cysteine ligase CoaBC [Armatimonadota bacterium]
MSVFEGKHILLGVTGSIAAYKAADIASKLTQAGAEVDVVLTEHARRFVTEVTFRAITRRPVLIDLFDEPEERQIAHIHLAKRADVLLIAPATANILAKLAVGLADDLLTTLALATQAKVVIAPAMNTVMWQHPATQHNVRILEERGALFVYPAEGMLACGDVGAGKLADTPTILSAVETALAPPLRGVRLLVTAGPTEEPVDAVRHLSNPSSGKMGYAIAQEAVRQGAEVTLVTGPTLLDPPAGARVVRVRSAQQMLDACLQVYDAVDVVIAAAAVSDYRPAEVWQGKRKKGEEEWTIRLVPNPDILRTLGERKGGRILVGFAAETHELLENAQKKLLEKNLDLIVANDVSQEGTGFRADTNRVTLLWASGRQEQLPLMSKHEVARHLLQAVCDLLRAAKATKGASA